MSLFVLVHDAAGDRVARYDGMDSSTVASLLGATPFDLIDETAYVQFILAHQPVSLTPEQIVALLRSLAIDELNLGTQPLIKVERSAISLLVDELNLLRQRDNDRATDVAAALSLADLKVRWAARAALPDRTMTQAKTALQNKINAGTAD